MLGTSAYSPYNMRWPHGLSAPAFRSERYAWPGADVALRRKVYRNYWPVELVEGRPPTRLEDPDDLDNEMSVWPRLFNTLWNSLRSGNSRQK
jgi:hypothetical protein